MSPRDASHQRFMRAALVEAAKGLGRTHPNPAVGAVIVKGGEIIARGYHHRAGTPHAEALALEGAGPRAKGATLYSTLEPCDHWGRTPPCTEAILSAGIAQVVYASSDPNPLVDGKGLQRLRQHGVKVVAHVLREEADALNGPFFKFIRTGLPWVTLKAATTLDGKIATASGASKWITSEASRALAHAVRNIVDAVVVGAGTVEADDPKLTTRLAQGGGRTPVRVVLDPSLRTKLSSRLYRRRRGLRTIVIASGAPQARLKRFEAAGVEVWSVPSRRGGVDLRVLLARLASEGLLHVLVEGGATVHQRFLEAGLADAVALFVAPKLFGHAALTWTGGLRVTRPDRAQRLTALRAEQVGDDLLITGLLVR